MTAYLDKPIYYPESERYGTFSVENSARHDLSVPEVLQSVAQMAMKAHGDTLLVWYGLLTIPDNGTTQPLTSAWLSLDGSKDSRSGRATEQRIKISRLVAFQKVIADEDYSLYLISKP